MPNCTTCAFDNSWNKPSHMRTFTGSYRRPTVLASLGYYTKSNCTAIPISVAWVWRQPCQKLVRGDIATVLVSLQRIVATWLLSLLRPFGIFETPLLTAPFWTCHQGACASTHYSKGLPGAHNAYLTAHRRGFSEAKRVLAKIIASHLKFT